MLPWLRQKRGPLLVGLASLAIGVVARLASRRLLKALRCPRECRLDSSANVLLALGQVELSALESFFGTVLRGSGARLAGKRVFVCGDLALADVEELRKAGEVFVIREISQGELPFEEVELGRVPLSVHGVGVLYKRFFGEIDCFKWVGGEHTFQTLTESNKPGTAYRTGAYLTKVEEEGDEARFRLLRCSTNFAGPTLGFGESDEFMVGAVDREAGRIFEGGAELNHVLAQVYHNSPATAERKQAKAKIKDHSDKTKDMPPNGSMAFCSFYEDLEKLGPLAGDAFDLGVNGTSGLARLHFRRKACVSEGPREFSVPLYPNSAFFMPLSTNRKYTHEIQPGRLEASRLPTRMGYVVRCSAMPAVHMGGVTYVKGRALQPATQEKVQCLRALYAQENRSDEVLEYGEVDFSMNAGDYMRPQVGREDFRLLAMRESKDNPFGELLESVRFEEVGKGRRGAVLVRQAERGVPLVRTTTKYEAPPLLFREAHARLAERIRELARLQKDFNNVLAESYSNEYTTMGFHSDQELDLEENSFIALYSCYEKPELRGSMRKLVVERKDGGASFEVPLSQNSVVVFSVEANRRFRHKIVLTGRGQENRWLGLTFRSSKTFVKFGEGGPSFEDGAELTLADEEERRAFFRMRREENAGTGFAYPRLTYTISRSDLLPPS